MRKRIVDPVSREEAAARGCLAEVEITSEAAAYPIESALQPEGGPGGRAADSGL